MLICFFGFSYLRMLTGGIQLFVWRRDRGGERRRLRIWRL
jgi:hypothetical protein